jgi:hypothetical protein
LHIRIVPLVVERIDKIYTMDVEEANVNLVRSNKCRGRNELAHGGFVLR